MHCLALCGCMTASQVPLLLSLHVVRQGGPTLWQTFCFLYLCCSKMAMFLHIQMGNKNMELSNFGNPAHFISNLCILAPFWELFFFVVGASFWEMLCGMWLEVPEAERSYGQGPTASCDTRWLHQWKAKWNIFVGFQKKSQFLLIWPLTHIIAFLQWTFSNLLNYIVISQR